MTASDLRYFGPPYEERFKPGASLDRDLDTSALSANSYRLQVHKDYIGHVFRYGFAKKFSGPGTRVLDVGCGRDLGLMYALCGHTHGSIPDLYVGVDVNTGLRHPRRRWVRVHEESDVVDAASWLEILYGQFNLIVSLEVIEHVSPRLALGHLEAMVSLMTDDARLLLSTPVYSHQFKMAKNHVNERTKAEIEDDLHRVGLKIVRQFGVFGNYRDFVQVLSPDERARYDEQREFYGDDVMGCFLAPRFPEASRNVLHVCVLETSEEEECELKESVVR